MKKALLFFIGIFLVSACYKEDEPLFMDTKKKLIGKWFTKKTRRSEYKITTGDLTRSGIVSTSAGDGFEFTSTNFLKFSATRVNSDYLYSVTGENEITVQDPSYKILQIKKLTADSLIITHTDATTFPNTRVVTDYYNVP